MVMLSCVLEFVGLLWCFNWLFMVGGGMNCVLSYVCGCLFVLLYDFFCSCGLRMGVMLSMLVIILVVWCVWCRFDVMMVIDVLGVIWLCSVVVVVVVWVLVVYDDVGVEVG